MDTPTLIHRFCETCPDGKIGNEYHALLQCKNSEIVKLKKIEHLYIFPSMYTRINLLKCLDINVSGKLGLF